MEQNNYPQPPQMNQSGVQPATPYYGMPKMKPQMGFVEAVKTCIVEKYCCFNGRARRSEYWWFVLAMMLLQTVLSTITMGIFFASHDLADYMNDPLSLLTSPGYIISCLVGLALFLPSLGALVRRMHDVGKSGHWLWLYFVVIIPLVGAIVLLAFFIVLIIWTTRDSDPQPNKYGPSPKYN